MKVLLDRLGASPSEFRFEAEPAWWERGRSVLAEVEPQVVEPLCFELRAYRMGEDVYLEGAASGVLELQCGRCLARYRHALREPFRLVLEAAGPHHPLEPESAAALARDGMCVGDELEAGWFRGNEIDLVGFLVEVVALALPVQPLCREECRGLCPGCGVDRNLEGCSCAQELNDSPFAALRVLRGGPASGGH